MITEEHATHVVLAAAVVVVILHAAWKQLLPSQSFNNSLLSLILQALSSGACLLYIGLRIITLLTMLNGVDSRRSPHGQHTRSLPSFFCASQLSSNSRRWQSWCCPTAGYGCAMWVEALEYHTGIAIWRFPKSWGYPQSSSILVGCPWNKPSSYGGSPIYGNSHVCIVLYSYVYLYHAISFL